MQSHSGWLSEVLMKQVALQQPPALRGAVAEFLDWLEDSTGSN